jgi:hypothetical protein
LGSVIPGGGVSLPIPELQQAQRLFRLHGDTEIEEATEALASLARLSGELAAEGNPGGSNRVADALLDLLERHLGACHRARDDGSTDRAATYPVDLVLRSVLVYATQRIGESRNSSEQNALSEIARRALGLSQSGDSAAVMVTTALPSARDRALTAPELELLWLAGVRAIALRTRSEWSIVSGSLEGYLQKPGSSSITPVEIAGRLVLYSIWADQFEAPQRWQWFWKATAKVQTGERVLYAVRVGAAALLAGCISAAIRIAQDLQGENIEGLRTYIKEEDISARESLLSQMYGSLLGSDPEEAMTKFLDFTESAHAAII